MNTTFDAQRTPFVIVSFFSFRFVSQKKNGKIYARFHVSANTRAQTITCENDRIQILIILFLTNKNKKQNASLTIHYLSIMYM